MSDKKPLHKNMKAAAKDVGEHVSTAPDEEHYTGNSVEGLIDFVTERVTDRLTERAMENLSPAISEAAVRAFDEQFAKLPELHEQSRQELFQQLLNTPRKELGLS